MQIMKYGFKASKLGHIFISHLHGDHFLGLVGLLSSMNLNGRTEELHIYAPPPLKALMDLHFHVSETIIRYPLHYHPTYTDDNIRVPEILLLMETRDFTISTIPLQHSIPCKGFLIEEKNPPRKIKKEMVQELNIPAEAMDYLKKGLEYTDPEGNTYLPELLTESPRRIRKYAFCSDTRYLPELSEILSGITTLYHETTFGHDFLPRAELTFHTTVTQAAHLARDMGADKLLMGHFSARYRDLNPLLEEAHSVFPNAFLGLEGTTFPI
jgi:ribonuclease Z